MYVEKLIQARGYNSADLVKVSSVDYVIPDVLHIIDSSNIRVNSTIITEIREQVTESIVIVLYLHATHEALKKSQEPVRFDRRRENSIESTIELFNIRYLYFDFTSLIPIYHLYTDKNIKNTHRRKIPQIKATDPSVKYYGFKSGDYIAVDDTWHKTIYFVI